MAQLGMVGSDRLAAETAVIRMKVALAPLALARHWSLAVPAEVKA
jgi:hypothetical protein